MKSEEEKWDKHSAHLTKRKLETTGSDDSEETVEKIINHVEHHDGSWEFKITWEGYGSEWDLWFDEEMIPHCKDLIARYKSTLENQSEEDGVLWEEPSRKPITVDKRKKGTVNDTDEASGEKDELRDCRRMMTFHHIEKGDKKKNTNKVGKEGDSGKRRNLILPGPRICGTSISTRGRKENLWDQAREAISARQSLPEKNVRDLPEDEDPTESAKRMKTTKSMKNCNEEENQNAKREDTM